MSVPGAEQRSSLHAVVKYKCTLAAGSAGDGEGVALAAAAVAALAAGVVLLLAFAAGSTTACTYSYVRPGSARLGTQSVGEPRQVRIPLPS